jgi:hypothetical protein
LLKLISAILFLPLSFKYSNMIIARKKQVFMIS